MSWMWGAARTKLHANGRPWVGKHLSRSAWLGEMNRWWHWAIERIYWHGSDTRRKTHVVQDIRAQPNWRYPVSSHHGASQRRGSNIGITPLHYIMLALAPLCNQPTLWISNSTINFHAPSVKHTFVVDFLLGLEFCIYIQWISHFMEKLNFFPKMG